MDLKQGLIIAGAVALAPLFKKWVYDRPAKYGHDLAWKHLPENSVWRKILFKKL